jgi:hypothetical protein
MTHGQDCRLPEPPHLAAALSFVQREVARIGEALRQPQSGAKYAELYAAQQALMWALEPNGSKSPFDMLSNITDTPEDLGGYPGETGHSASSSILDHREI